MGGRGDGSGSLATVVAAIVSVHVTDATSRVLFFTRNAVGVAWSTVGS